MKKYSASGLKFKIFENRDNWGHFSFELYEFCKTFVLVLRSFEFPKVCSFCFVPLFSGFNLFTPLNQEQIFSDQEQAIFKPGAEKSKSFQPDFLHFGSKSESDNAGELVTEIRPWLLEASSSGCFGGIKNFAQLV